MDDFTLTLFDEFASRRARGERPDPIEYLDRAGYLAHELAPLIERLALDTPPPEPTDAARERVRSLLAGESPLLRLRLSRGLRMGEVSERLVRELGLASVHSDKVRHSYQKLEAGQIDVAGVDLRLAEALARVLGVAEEDLPGWGGRWPMEYARRPAGFGGPTGQLRGDSAPAPSRDEVDQLFGLT